MQGQIGASRPSSHWFTSQTDLRIDKAPFAGARIETNLCGGSRQGTESLPSRGVDISSGWDVEPVSVLSNRVSSNKIWISKNRDQRLTREIRRMPPKFQEIQPQRLRKVPLTRGNVAPISARRTCPTETALVGWGARTSNLGMAESKSAALPLGYAPTRCTGADRAGRRADHSGRSADSINPRALRRPSVDFCAWFSLHHGRRVLASRSPETSHDLPRAGCRHRLCAQACRRASAPALAEGLYGDLARGRGRRGAGRGRPVRHRGARRRSTRSATASARVFKDGAVTTPPGWKEAYRAWAAAGWNGLAAPEQWGGQDLPHARQRRLHRDVEFGRHGVRHRPGADHGRRSMRSPRTAARRSSAPICRSSSPANGWAPCSSPSRRPAPTSARCAPRPSAPATAAIASPARRSSSPTASTTSPTTSSISCWRGCPTRRRARAASRCSWCRNSCVNADGSLGARNDVRAHSIEHKLGIHGSPTCTMVFGDQGGATGYLIGEENRGMACMFTMMNQARLVGRPAGRRHRRARHPAGARLCARAPAGPRGRRRSAARARSSPIPTSSACC